MYNITCMKGTIGFYAFDVSPGKQMLPLIVQAARERGFAEPVMPEAQRRGAAMERMEEFRRCVAVILGLSSEETMQEVELAQELVKEGVPVFAVADTFRSLERPKAKAIAPHVTAGFVALPGDRESAEQFGYQRVEYVGPPPQDRKSVV